MLSPIESFNDSLYLNKHMQLERFFWQFLKKLFLSSYPIFHNQGRSQNGLHQNKVKKVAQKKAGKP